MFIIVAGLPAALAILLHLQMPTLLNAQFTNAFTNATFTNATIRQSASNPSTSAPTYYNVTNAVGAKMQCVGPTGPPGLSWPIQTVVEKLTEVSGPTTASYAFGDAHGEWTKVPFTATGATTLYTTFTRELVPQYGRHEYPYRCCGQCTVYFSSVDVMYWPVPGANTACLDSGTNPGVNPASATVPPSNNSISTLISNGFTFSSPSIYVAYNDISASDFCGQVGSKHTSITLAFEPGQLSTIPYRAGLFGRGGDGGVAEPFDLKHLPCPPQSLIDAQESANEPLLSLPMRGTYAPIIAPPPAIQSMDPAWKTCVSFYAFDPPKTLVPASVMAPSPTPAKLFGTQAMPAAPSPTIDSPPNKTPTADRTAATDDPGRAVDPISAADRDKHPAGNVPSLSDTHGPSPNEGEPNKHPADNVPSLSDTQGPSPNEGDPNKHPAGNVPSLSDTQGPSPKEGEPNKHPADDVPSLSDSQGPPPNEGEPNKAGEPLDQASITVDPPTRSTNPKSAADPATAAESQNQPMTDVPLVSGTRGTRPRESGSSEFNVSPVNKGGEVSPAEDPHRSPSGQLQSNAPVIAVGGHTLTAVASGGFAIGDSILLANAPAITILSTPISVGNSMIVAGSSTAYIPSGNSNGVFTAAGHAFTPQSDSAVILAGKPLSVNGPAATVSGTVISVASSGLMIGGQNFALPTPQPGPTFSPKAVFTIGGLSVLPLGVSSVIVQGATLSINGPATTASGIALSLASAGVVIGGQTFAFPTSAPGKVGDTVVIDGATLTAGAPAQTISGIPVSLAIGSAGLYVAGLGSGSAAFSAPVVAGESLSVNRAGQIMVDGKTVSDSEAGSAGLGSVIMLGFDAANTVGSANPIGTDSGAGPANGSAATGALAFTGEGRKRLELSIIATLVPVSVFLGWHLWNHVSTQNDVLVMR